MDLINYLPPVAIANAMSKDSFENTSNNGLQTIIVVIVLIMLVVWIVTIVASYKIVKDNKVLHAILCAVFGVFYITLAWMIFGFTKPNSL